MLIVPPIPFRRKRKSAAPAPPGAALLLLSATYEPEDPSVLLGFDRAINIAGLVASTITVADQVHGLLLRGVGAELLTAEVVQVDLEVVGSSSGTGVLLNASGGNGIVAVNDGGLWAGATNQALPF